MMSPAVIYFSGWSYQPDMVSVRTLIATRTRSGLPAMDNEFQAQNTCRVWPMDCGCHHSMDFLFCTQAWFGAQMANSVWFRLFFLEIARCVGFNTFFPQKLWLFFHHFFHGQRCRWRTWRPFLAKNFCAISPRLLIINRPSLSGDSLPMFIQKIRKIVHPI